MTKQIVLWCLVFVSVISMFALDNGRIERMLLVVVMPALVATSWRLFLIRSTQRRSFWRVLMKLPPSQS